MATAAHIQESRPRSSIRAQSIERPLLLVAGLFLLINYLALALVNETTSLLHWQHLIAWSLCAITGHLWLEHHLPQRDPFIFPLTLFLAGWGLLVIDRLAPAFADRQSLWLLVGTLLMLWVACFPHALRWLRSYRYILLFVGLLLLTGTILLGRNPSGLLGAPQLWLGFGSVYFQPSEALKIILVAFLASYLAEQYPALRAEELSSGQGRLIFSPRIVGPILMMWGLSIIILVWQRDLGTAILFFVVFLGLLYIASGSLWILLSGAALILVAGLAGYQLFNVVQLRVDIWLNPWPEADGRAYQIVQSLMAFAAGGIFGQGIGQGLPDFIPVVHSDFIFAALGEEWGLLGIAVLVICLAVLVARGLQIAVTQQTQP
ncbi:MAG: FtsW/RodA/SpoVE family cell cycle protein, partial [Anaerolineae bacterium]|nr:FtsW/RodA/SpoVE family cell cycle protein [Anaerolineae bacterium]